MIRGQANHKAWFQDGARTAPNGGLTKRPQEVYFSNKIHIQIGQTFPKNRVYHIAQRSLKLFIKIV